jgi:predicted enzyme related to lactoylglutathione lyase
MMSNQTDAGAVLYAKNLAPVLAFYQAVASLAVEHLEKGHAVLASSSFQLVILKIPERTASSIEIESPPKRRTETPIKLVFFIASIAKARAAAALHGGEISPPEREWTFQGYRVCDGQDPEGNVVQFREKAR